MTDAIHTKRDSLDGFNRKRLRGTLRLAMGIKPNSAMFESRGQSWHTTESEQRQETVRRQELERALREAGEPDKKPYKPSETRKIDGPRYSVVKPIEGKPTEQQKREIEDFILSKLEDAGPLEPVKVDKQRLAKEKKKERPLHSSRRVAQNKHTTLASKVNRLAQLHKELTANERVAAKTTDKYKAFDHFTLEID